MLVGAPQTDRVSGSSNPETELGATTNDVPSGEPHPFEFGDDCKTLVPKEHHGRSDVPTSRFNLGADTPYVEIVTMLNTHKAVLYDDVDEQPPQGWDPTHTHGYRCFVRAPIRSKRHIYGMLTVDTPEPGTLGETDAELLSTVTTILAAGYAAQHAASRIWPSLLVVGSE